MCTIHDELICVQIRKTENEIKANNNGGSVPRSAMNFWFLNAQGYINRWTEHKKLNFFQVKFANARSRIFIHEQYGIFNFSF